MGFVSYMARAEADRAQAEADRREAVDRPAAESAMVGVDSGHRIRFDTRRPSMGDKTPKRPPKPKKPKAPTA